MLGPNYARYLCATLMLMSTIFTWTACGWNSKATAGDRLVRAQEAFPVDLVEANKTLQEQLDSVLRINAQLEWQLQRLVVMNNRFADTVQEMKDRNPAEKLSRKPMLLRYRRTRTGALIGELVQ